MIKKRWLILLILVAGFWRFYRLGDYPVGFLPKEALLAYRGFSLASFGLDETGRYLPLFFSSFTGYQGPWSSYLIAALTAILSPGMATVRLAFALVGFFGFLAFLIISAKLFIKNSSAFWWAGVIFALSPWQVFLSRSPSEWNLLFNLTLIVAAIFVWLPKEKGYFWGAINLVVGIILGLVFIKAVPWRVFALDQVKFFTDPSIINGINRMRGEGSIVAPLSRFFYNKGFYGTRLIENFLDHLKVVFYFAKGEGNPLHGLSNFGPLPVVLLPAFFLGLFKIAKEDRYRIWRLPLLLFSFLGMLPSLFSKASPDQEKLIWLLPIFAWVMAAGAAGLKRSWQAMLGALLFLNLCFLAYDGIYKEPDRAAHLRCWGTEEMAKEVIHLGSGVDKIFISDSYCPDTAPYFIEEELLDPKTLVKETNLDEGSLNYHQWIGRLGKLVFGQKDSWNFGDTDKVVLVLEPDQLQLLEEMETTQDEKGKEKQRCFDLAGEIEGKDKKPIYLIFTSKEKCEKS